MKLKFIYSLIVCFWFTSVLIESRRDCIGRKGKTTNYCVCNTSYCDDLDPIVKQNKGSVLQFQTNQNGDRFKESKLTFTKDNNHLKDAIILTIDKSKKFQKILGFGGAFTDAAGLNINTLPKDLAENLIKDYYSANGIEYSMGRIPIAGCDFSPRSYSYDDQKDDFDLKSFKLQKEDIEYKIPYIKIAEKVSPHKIKLYGSPWSAPAWMKNNNKFNEGGALFGQPGEKYYKTWANYFVKFLDAYKSNDIHLWGLTVQNEPGWAAWSSLDINMTLERDFVKKDLGPALAQAGYGTDKLNVMVYDNGPGNHFLEFVDTCFNDPGSVKYFTGIAYHCYGANGNWNLLDKLHDKYPNYFLLMSECCQGFEKNSVPPKLVTLGDWDNAMDYAHVVMNNMYHWVTGWVEWNLALDMYGHPNWANMMSNAPVHINATAKEYYKNPTFYILGHYTKFIAPDSVRVSITSTNTGLSLDNFNFVAFDRPDNSTVVIVYNFSNKPIDLVINDQSNGNIVTKIGEHSIQTYVYWN